MRSSDSLLPCTKQSSLRDDSNHSRASAQGSGSGDGTGGSGWGWLSSGAANLYRQATDVVQNIAAPDEPLQLYQPAGGVASTGKYSGFGNQDGLPPRGPERGMPSSLPRTERNESVSLSPAHVRPLPSNPMPQPPRSASPPIHTKKLGVPPSNGQQQAKQKKAADPDDFFNSYLN
jgi:hypothetical protein